MDYCKDDIYYFSETTVVELRSLVDSDEFPVGSIETKVEVLTNFMNSDHDNEISSCITSLEKQQIIRKLRWHLS